MFSALEPYRSLFDPSRWTDLVIQFRHENYRLYQLGSQSVLAVALQVNAKYEYKKYTVFFL